MVQCLDCGCKLKGWRYNRKLQMCYDCARPRIRTEMLKRSKAGTLLSEALKSGELVKPSTCELCGVLAVPLVGHHWCGYDYPTDVWFICRSCNNTIKGDQWHSGSATKTEARNFIANRRKIAKLRKSIGPYKWELLQRQMTDDEIYNSHIGQDKYPLTR